MSTLVVAVSCICMRTLIPGENLHSLEGVFSDQSVRTAYSLVFTSWLGISSMIHWDNIWTFIPDRTLTECLSLVWDYSPTDSSDWSVCWACNRHESFAACVELTHWFSGHIMGCLLCDQLHRLWPGLPHRFFTNRRFHWLISRMVGMGSAMSSQKSVTCFLTLFLGYSCRPTLGPPMIRFLLPSWVWR